MLAASNDDIRAAQHLIMRGATVNDRAMVTYTLNTL